MRPLLFLALVFAAACGGSQQPAPEPTATTPAAAEPTAEPALPPAAEILDRSVEAIGGRDAVLAVTSVHGVGTMNVVNNGISGRMELWQKVPDLGRVEVDMTGLGKQVVVSDGTHVWESSSVAGVRLLEGEELRTRLRDFDLHAEVNWREHFPTVETLGREDVNGEAAWVVKLTPAEGNPITRWYSVESGLQLQSKTKVKSPMGEVETTTIVDDYREHDGMLVAHHSKQLMMGAELEIVLESYETNVDIPADRFAPTPEVKKLIDAAAAKAPAEGDAAAPAAAKP